MGSLKERAVDVMLVVGCLVCVVLLAAMLKMVLVHICCGVLFMGVAAYTMHRGQEAPSRLASLGWYVCTGAVLFLFTYWSLQVVFRPPKVPTTIGCGGVNFINTPLGGDEPGGMRTEL